MDRSWMMCPEPRPGARCRLFCLPFAGAGAAQFLSWKALLPDSVELCAYQLPGRESRYREPAFVRAEEAAEHVAQEMLPWLDRPYAMFGHSMGALLTFEVARALRRRSAPLPFLLLLSAYPAAHLRRVQTPVSGLPEAQLIDRLRQMDGTPEAILHDRELMNFLLPTIRADFELCETYQHREELPLPMPVIAFGGDRDQEAPPERIAAWRRHTSSSFTHRTLPGGHFFLHTSRQQLLAHVVEALQVGL